MDKNGLFFLSFYVFKKCDLKNFRSYEMGLTNKSKNNHKRKSQVSDIYTPYRYKKSVWKIDTFGHFHFILEDNKTDTTHGSQLNDIQHKSPLRSKKIGHLLWDKFLRNYNPRKVRLCEILLVKWQKYLHSIDSKTKSVIFNPREN